MLSHLNELPTGIVINIALVLKGCKMAELSIFWRKVTTFKIFSLYFTFGLYLFFFFKLGESSSPQNIPLSFPYLGKSRRLAHLEFNR